MIKNAKQVAIAKADLEQLEKERQDLINNREEMSDIAFTLTVDSLNGLIEDLTNEINYYTQLISEGFHCFKSKPLDNLSEILISARIAQGISQKELAVSIGIQEQQIQRYEQTDYEGASLTRLLEVRDALNIELNFHDIYIIGKKPDFLLPSNVTAGDVEIVEAKVKESCSLNFITT